jgi:hypothetical protein
MSIIHNVAKLWEQKLEMPPKSFAGWVKEGQAFCVPKEVVDILKKCMATKASERPSFEELCTE